MLSPFPGMDPYLEHPEIWPGVHHRLIVAIADLLSVQLRPKYSVSIEVRMYETSNEESLTIGITDPSARPQKGQINPSNLMTYPLALVEPQLTPLTVKLPLTRTVRQGYLEIIEVETKQVITTIEVLSQINKQSGKKRDAYIAKREHILGSATNFIEIDLLRFGEPMPVLEQTGYSHYQILVSRRKEIQKGKLYTFTVHDKIPSFSLPLRPEDAEPMIYLRDLLTNIYQIGSYELKIDYSQEPVPELSENDARLVDALLRWQGMR